MNTFSIRDIENLCGIKAPTLRVWEQRYQFLRPKRKVGNHRYYDSEDLKYLLRVAFLYHHGHKPSILARLDDKELIQLIIRIPPSITTHEAFVNNLLEASLDYDQEVFDLILYHLIQEMGFEKAIGDVVFPFLTKIGRLWLSGHLVPAQEHFVSAIITQKLLLAIDELDGQSPATTTTAAEMPFLLFTPNGAFQEIPLLYMRYLMKKNGRPVTYFGHNVGIETLQRYCAVKPVSHLYVQIAIPLPYKPEEYVRKLLEVFPDKTLVVSGAPGESYHDRLPRLHILKNLEEMEAFARGE
jgi:hypothetical protein